MENNTEYDKTMKRARIVRRSMRILRLVAMLFTMSAIFVLIWGTYSLAWRVGITGLIITVLSHFIHRIVDKAMNDAVDIELERRESLIESSDGI
jgi:4-hydroxybenzoate polyprenyltransferase